MKIPYIFDIQHSSFVDGPGIRTTVFFKGCNLRCAWCHNPESQNSEREMMFRKDKCTSCGKCREVCQGSLEKCVFCGKCQLLCANNARKIVGREMSIDEIFAEIVKDKAFFDASGGGVTFSGGECMLYPEFLCEILKKCKEKQIHTAIDTAGAVPPESFDLVLPYTDMFLYDIKLATDELHKKWVGASNKLITENLKKLSDGFQGDIITRIPVIGGVNDNVEEMIKIKELISGIKHKSVELLPYHKLGEDKYTALGKSRSEFTVPPEEIMSKLKKLFENTVMEQF